MKKYTGRMYVFFVGLRQTANLLGRPVPLKPLGVFFHSSSKAPVGLCYPDPLLHRVVGRRGKHSQLPLGQRAPWLTALCLHVTPQITSCRLFLTAEAFPGVAGSFITAARCPLKLNHLLLLKGPLTQFKLPVHKTKAWKGQKRKSLMFYSWILQYLTLIWPTEPRFASPAICSRYSVQLRDFLLVAIPAHVCLRWF